MKNTRLHVRQNYRPKNILTSIRTVRKEVRWLGNTIVTCAWWPKLHAIYEGSIKELRPDKVMDTVAISAETVNKSKNKKSKFNFRIFIT